MSNIILLIDDKESFKESFKITSQRKGYHLAWGKSYEELVDKVNQFHEHICTIVLDIKCLLKNDQEIEDENFILSAILYLSNNFPNIPRVVLTGDETAFEKFSHLLGATNEIIFTKSLEDIENMFLTINEHKANYPTRMYNEDQQRVKKAIDEGENEKVEFKSVLYCNIFDKKKNKKNAFKCVRSIAAFLNSKGGTLLIGVSDDKSILGLENFDYTLLNGDDKADLFKLELDNLIKTTFGDNIHRIINIKIIEINDKNICEIRILNKNYKPTYITKKEVGENSRDAFYIRRSASTSELIKNEKEEYIKEHWK